jgi:hypothetical protein
MRRYTFTVSVAIEPSVLVLSQDGADDRTPIEVVSDEIESNLDSVPYVRSVQVHKGVENDCEIPQQRQGQPSGQAR